MEPIEMGVWGTGIFQDDTACDLRGDYKDYLGEGLKPLEARQRILKDYEGSLADPDEAGVVWLALAAAQWKLGRLDPETLEQALNVMESGSDLSRWEGRDRVKRNQALENLRAQITSPQPPEKRVARHLLSECHWKVGEVVSLRLLSGRLTLFRVIGHNTDKGGTYPILELLDWVGEVLPSIESLQSIGLRKSRTDYKHTINRVMLVGINKKAASRIEGTEAMLKPVQEYKRGLGSTTVIHWKHLDAFLKEWFLLE